MIETYKFHCFKCIKNYEEINDLTSGEYLLYREPYSKDTSYKVTVHKYSFFGHNQIESVWLSDVNNLFFHANKGIEQLTQAALKTESSTQTVNYCEIRYQICELWLATRDIILKYGTKNEWNDTIKNLVSTIKRILESITKISELPEYVLFNSTINSDVRFNASYNFLHLYLDLKWISLTIDLNNAFVNKDNIEQNIISLFKDLIYVGVKKFERNISYLESTSAYLCSCFKELWLLLQLLIEKTEYSNCFKDFWSYFNQAINEILNFQKNSDGKDALCCLWLLRNVSQIHGYDSQGNFIGEHNLRVVSNYPLVEDCLKHILQATCDENRLQTALQLIIFLQVKWWTRDATFDLLQMQWEHFYKRIHTSFVLTTDENVFINTSQKLCNFVTLTDKILNCDPSASNSYEIFLYLLSYFLKKNPSFWSKLKGRIYSKLSASKLATFNDTGLQNLVMLLLILSHSLNFNELTEKLFNLLNQLPANRCENNSIIWSAHMSLIIVYIKRDISIKNVSTSLLNLVELASVNRSRSQLMRLFIDGLCLVEENSTNLQCGQHVLFGKLNYIIFKIVLVH